MSIQGSINSMISSAAHGVMAIKGYQELKKKQAEKTAAVATKQPIPKQVTREQANAMMAKQGQDQIEQKKQFSDYIGGLETSLGGKVSDLPEAMQKQIYKQLNEEKDNGKS